MRKKKAKISEIFLDIVKIISGIVILALLGAVIVMMVMLATTMVADAIYKILFEKSLEERENIKSYKCHPYCSFIDFTNIEQFPMNFSFNPGDNINFVINITFPDVETIKNKLLVYYLVLNFDRNVSDINITSECRYYEKHPESFYVILPNGTWVEIKEGKELNDYTYINNDTVIKTVILGGIERSGSHYLRWEIKFHNNITLKSWKTFGMLIDKKLFE